ncbi:integrase [Pasteurella langaaensis DSM 22999]|uniref:Integrase n=1 Tax=Alitibacter langaaensis DSM 22999 TaxID=1122935 RepID=A0A2U0T8C2_9PAST|nr:integrase arm-type DNA-binding domain-containing protein [Pasteurella langaaensis]PVX39774.1 integrase [Pasteurella langaaensis DSM 22999]
MARITKALTNTEVNNAKAKTADYKLMDGKGLFLLVKKTGVKIWRFNYFKPYSKARTEISLGTFPNVSLAQARAIREEYRALLAQDIDPQEHRQQIQEEEQARRENTFLHLAELWKAKMLVDVKNGELKEETFAKNWTIITKYLLPELGAMPIESITPKQVIQTIRPLDERGRAETRDRAIALLNRVMKFAVNCNALEFNKCVNVKDHYSRPKAEHFKTIRPEELPELLTALRDYQLSTQTKLLIKWQLLTMTRPNESVGALWEEIDLNAKTWTIPPHKMKMKVAHVIPLSTQALAILAKMRNISSHCPYIFQSEVKPQQPMNKQTANRALRLIGFHGRLVSHGMRAIASTYLNERLINSDVIESCLAHGIKDQVRKAYNRADYLEERRKVMQIWGDYVESCSNGI